MGTTSLSLIGRGQGVTTSESWCQGVTGGQPRPFLRWEDGAGEGSLRQGLQELSNLGGRFVLGHVALDWGYFGWELILWREVAIIRS